MRVFFLMLCQFMIISRRTRSLGMFVNRETTSNDTSTYPGGSLTVVMNLANSKLSVMLYRLCVDCWRIDAIYFES